MKTSTKLILLPLTVLCCVRCNDMIKVQGYEGGDAVIDCPSQKDYESYPKYLLRGRFSKAIDVIRSDGRAEWTHRGRVSLQDKKSRSIFTVTIRKLTLEDAGKYGCGVDTWGSDFYRQVSLKVATRPKPVIPKVTTRGTMATHTSISVTTHNATSGWLSENTATKAELVSDATHFQSDPTPATSGELVYLSGGLIAALVLFFLLILMFAYIKSRAHRKQASPSGLPGNSRRDSCEYSEIQHTSLNATEVPRQRDRRSSSALNTIYALATPAALSTQTANQLPQHAAVSMQAATHLPPPNPASDDIYSLATNPMQALHSGPPSANNQELEFDTAIYSNLTLANVNLDCCDYAVVVFSDEPISSDSVSVRLSKTPPSPPVE